ncbi:MAG: esterase-like activity of phytase family protein, partial [Bacteroidota bacterium]|nr:esterase-like activity of phytase family protein [Bacteroidota bacterium]
MKKIIFAIITSGVFISCSVTHKLNQQPVPINSLKYIGQYEAPYNQSFMQTTIGGLSGIDYDSLHQLYYIISDDRSDINAARFYTAKIKFTQGGIDTVQFINVTTFLRKNGTPFPSSKKDKAHSADPEAIRYNPISNQFVWTSEGERIVRKDTVILQDPSITIINTDGKYVDTFPLPPQMHMHATENGPRQNGVFEGLTFADNFKTMYVSVEEPLYEDGPRAGLKDTATWIRIIKYDVASQKPIAQYAYHISPIAHPSNPPNEFKINGIPDILYLGDKKLLVIERSFSTGIQACTIRVYLVDLAKASNVAATTSLMQAPPLHATTKKLLINMDSLGIYIDNIEGVTFGPDLPNGHKTLIF